MTFADGHASFLAHVMGIGRRDFLIAFGSTLAAVAGLPSPAVMLDADLYLNRRLGFAFHKPRGWHFADVAKMGAMQQGQLLSLEDEEVNRIWKSADALPIVTAGAEPLSTSGRYFSPAASVLLDPIDEHEPEPFLVAHEEIGLVSSMLCGWEATSPVRRLKVSSCAAAEYRARFLFEHVQLAQSTPVRMRTLLIHQDRWRYTLRMYDATHRPWNFESVVASVRVL